MAKFRAQGSLLIVRADLPERCSISVPAYRSAVPAQKYSPVMWDIILTACQIDQGVHLTLSQC